MKSNLQPNSGVIGQLSFQPQPDSFSPSLTQNGKQYSNFPSGQPNFQFPYQSQENPLRYDRITERTQNKLREMQSCISYLQDNGKLLQLHEILRELYINEKISQERLMNNDGLQRSPIQGDLSPQQNPMIIDTTEILRTNLKDILSLMIDDIWSNGGIPLMPHKQQNIQVLHAISQSNEYQQYNGGGTSRNLENSAYQSSNRSNKASSNQSKQTPASISKMNLTEMKQSLSQNLNRDFIEPPSQPQLSNSGGKPIVQLVSQGSARTSQFQTKEHPQMNLDYALSQQTKQNQALLKDVVIDDFSSSSQSEYDQSGSSHHSQVQKIQSSDYFVAHNDYQSEQINNRVARQAYGAISEDNSNTKRSNSISSNGQRQVFDYNEQQKGFEVSANDNNRYHVVRHHNPSQDYYVASRMNHVANNSDLLASQNQPFQTPQYMKFSETGNPISSPNTTSGGDNPNLQIIMNDHLLRQEANKQKLLALNLLSQENSCAKKDSKEIALFKYTTHVPQNQALPPHHKPQISLANQTSQPNTNDYFKVSKTQTKRSNGEGRLQSNGSSDQVRIISLSNMNGSNQSNGNLSQNSRGQVNQDQADNKLHEIMLKNIWEIENNPMFNTSREETKQIEDDEQLKLHRENLKYVNLESDSSENQEQNQSEDSHKEDININENIARNPSNKQLNKGGKRYQEDEDSLYYQQMQQHRFHTQQHQEDDYAEIVHMGHVPIDQLSDDEEELLHPHVQPLLSSNSVEKQGQMGTFNGKKISRIPAHAIQRMATEPNEGTAQRFRRMIPTSSSQSSSANRQQQFRTPKASTNQVAADVRNMHRISQNLEQASPKSNIDGSSSRRRKELQRELSASSNKDRLNKLSSMKQAIAGLSEDSPSNWMILGSQTKPLNTEVSEQSKQSMKLNHSKNRKKLLSQNPPNEFQSSEVMAAARQTTAAATLTTQPDCNSLFGPASSYTGTNNDVQMVTKISAEELIRNYTNANFMPQKQANDRLQLLCQSKELNPLVSLMVDNQNNSSTDQPPQQLQKKPLSTKGNSYLSSSSVLQTGPQSSQVGTDSLNKKLHQTANRHNYNGQIMRPEISLTTADEFTLRMTKPKTPTHQEGVHQVSIGNFGIGMPNQQIQQPKKSRNAALNHPNTHSGQHAQSLNTQLMNRNEDNLLSYANKFMPNQNQFMTASSAESRIVLNKLMQPPQGPLSKKSKSSSGGGNKLRKKGQQQIGDNHSSTSGSRLIGNLAGINGQNGSLPRSQKLNQRVNDSPGLSFGSLDSQGNRLQSSRLVAQGNSLKQLGLQVKEKETNKKSHSPFKNSIVSKRNITIQNSKQAFQRTLNIPEVKKISMQPTYNNEQHLFERINLLNVQQKREQQPLKPEFNKNMTSQNSARIQQSITQSDNETNSYHVFSPINQNMGVLQGKLKGQNSKQTIVSNQSMKPNHIISIDQSQNLQQLPAKRSSVPILANYQQLQTQKIYSQQIQEMPQSNFQSKKNSTQAAAPQQQNMNPQAIIYGKLLQKHMQNNNTKRTNFVDLS